MICGQYPKCKRPDGGCSCLDFQERIQGKNHDSRELERMKFEADAKPYGFDLTRHQCAAPEPWSEYADDATGQRWGGWLAAKGMA